MKNTAHQLETAHLEKLRVQISADIESLHEKEASLREYENRLRSLIDSTQPGVRPSGASQFLIPAQPNTAELEAAWEKYNRAHALLEAARRGLTDDRLGLRDLEERLQLREQEVSRREAWLKQRESEAMAAVAATVNPEVKSKASFTASSFLLAKNLLSPRRT